jgi:hypothetical protein
MIVAFFIVACVIIYSLIGSLTFGYFIAKVNVDNKIKEDLSEYWEDPLVIFGVIFWPIAWIILGIYYYAKFFGFFAKVSLNWFSKKQCVDLSQRVAQEEVLQLQKVEESLDPFLLEAQIEMEQSLKDSRSYRA